MLYMNDYDIDDAAERFANHPVLGPATRTLANLRDCVNRSSDGWAYWPSPCRAANKLQVLIQGDGSRQARNGARDDATVEALRSAYRPIRAFRTRHKLHFDIAEPA